MSRYNSCRVCGNASVSVYNILEQKAIDGEIVGKNRYYCSQECRNRDNKGFLRYLLVIIGIPLLLIIRSGGAAEIEFLFNLVITIVIIGFIVYLAKMRLDRINRDAEKLKNLAVTAAGYQDIEDEIDDTFAEYLEVVSDNESKEESQVVEEAISHKLPQRMDPEDGGQIYSDILQQYVDPCCYQSARLSDKYCMCGKAINYLVIDENSE